MRRHLEDAFLASSELKRPFVSIFCWVQLSYLSAGQVEELRFNFLSRSLSEASVCSSLSMQLIGATIQRISKFTMFALPLKY